MKKTFVMYLDRESYIENMNDNEQAELLRACFSYQKLANASKSQDELNDWLFPFQNRCVEIVFWNIKKMFDEDREKRENKRKVRVEAGKVGGLAKASKTKQKLAKAKKSETPININTVNVNELLYLEDINIENIKDNILEKFIYTQWNNIPWVKYQINKEWWNKYLAKQEESYKKLLWSINEKQIKYILEWIPTNDFRKSNIWSVDKLLKKNKDWIPYYLVMVNNIKSQVEKKESVVAFIPWI